MPTFDKYEPLGTRPVSELLPWLFLDRDGKTAICKDSSLLAVFEIQGIDSESVDQHGIWDAAQEFDQANRFLASNGIRQWQRADSYEDTRYPQADFSNEWARRIDMRWSEEFKAGLYKKKQIIALGMPTQKRLRPLGEMMREYMDQGESLVRAFVHSAKNKVNQKKELLGFETAEDLANALSRFEQNIIQPWTYKIQMFKLRRLTGNELKGFFRACTSTREGTPLATHPYQYLDQACSETWIDNSYQDHLVYRGTKNQVVGVFSLKDAPGANRLAALDHLLALPFRLTISTVWVPSAPSVAIKNLNKARGFDELRQMDFKSLFRGVMRGGEDLMDGDSEPTTDVGKKAVAAIKRVKSNGDMWGYLACTILIYADDEQTLDLRLESVQQILQKNELNFLREREGAISAMTVAIPGQMHYLVRWFNVEASNVTDLSPSLITLAQGSENHPYYGELDGHPVPALSVMFTRYHTQQFLNFHQGALGHALLVGPSRNGKTLAMMFWLSQMFKYKNANVIILDKDNSCRGATLMLDGVHMDLSPKTEDEKSSIKMNPIGRCIKEPGGITFLIEWIDRLMQERGDKLTDAEVDEVTRALQRLQNFENPHLSSLAAQLPGHLKLRLTPWLRDGAYGQYFDNEVDELDFQTWTCFELGGLISAGMQGVLKAFTDYAFYRIKSRLENIDLNHVGPTIIYFEEAGYLLDDPIFADRARDYLMTLAKLHANLVMTAQSPEPFFRNEKLKSAVRDNVATVIFLPNKNAVRGDLSAQLSTVFGLNENHQKLIAESVPKAEYCIWQPAEETFRRAVLRLPIEIVAALMSNVSTNALLTSYFEPNDPSWKDRYHKHVMQLLAN